MPLTLSRCIQAELALEFYLDTNLFIWERVHVLAGERGRERILKPAPHWAEGLQIKTQGSIPEPWDIIGAETKSQTHNLLSHWGIPDQNSSEEGMQGEAHAFQVGDQSQTEFPVIKLACSCYLSPVNSMFILITVL